MKPGGRVGPVDVMLGTAAVLAGLNPPVTKYVLAHGVDPRAFSAVRYLSAAAIFLAITYRRERSFRLERRDVGVALLAGAVLAGNQLGFVYALHYTTAATVALLFGAVPIFMGAGAQLAGFERMGRRFWASAALALGGVALIATSAGGVSGRLTGILIALATTLAWSLYSLLATPLMRTYSPYRLNGLLMAIAFLVVATVGAAPASRQDWSLGGLTWVGLAFTVLGPLVVFNVLWLHAIHRVGPSRSGLFLSFQPFLGAIFSVVLLGEALGWQEIVGGGLIAVAVVGERVGREAAPVVPAVAE